MDATRLNPLEQFVKQADDAAWTAFAPQIPPSVDEQEDVYQQLHKIARDSFHAELASYTDEDGFYKWASEGITDDDLDEQIFIAASGLSGDEISKLAQVESFIELEEQEADEAYEVALQDLHGIAKEAFITEMSVLLEGDEDLIKAALAEADARNFDTSLAKLAAADGQLLTKVAIRQWLGKGIAGFGSKLVRGGMLQGGGKWGTKAQRTATLTRPTIARGARAPGATALTPGGGGIGPMSRDMAIGQSKRTLGMGLGQKMQRFGSRMARSGRAAAESRAAAQQAARRLPAKPLPALGTPKPVAKAPPKAADPTLARGPAPAEPIAETAARAGGSGSLAGDATTLAKTPGGVGTMADWEKEIARRVASPAGGAPAKLVPAAEAAAPKAVPAGEKVLARGPAPVESVAETAARGAPAGERVVAEGGRRTSTRDGLLGTPGGIQAAGADMMRILRGAPTPLALGAGKDVSAAHHAYKNLRAAAKANPGAVTPELRRSLVQLSKLNPKQKAAFMTQNGWLTAEVGPAGIASQMANTGRIGLPTAAGAAARSAAATEAAAVQKLVAQGATPEVAQATVKAEAAAAAKAAPAAEAAAAAPAAEGAGTGFGQWFGKQDPWTKGLMAGGAGLGAGHLLSD